MSKSNNKPKNFTNPKGKGNPKNKGGYDKRDKRGKDDVKDGDMVVAKSGPANDPGMYKPDGVLMEQVTNFSFRNFLGMRNVISDKVYGVPTTMVIRLTPSLTRTAEADSNARMDGVNMAAYRLWLWLTYRNKRPVTYAPQDLITLLCAIGSIYALASDITRTFGISRVWNFRNKTYPAEMIKYLQCGDLSTQQIADLRADFNYAINQFNNFPVPGNIDYLQKCAKIFSGIYLDEGGSNMAQTYLFTWSSLWKYNDAYSDNGTGCDTVYFNNSLHNTLEGKINLFKELCTAVCSSTSLSVIQGDIKRVADEEGWPMMTLGEVPYDYIVLPAVDDEMALWLDNATIVGNPTRHDDFILSAGFTPDNDIVPSVDKNCVIYRPVVPMNRAVTADEAPEGVNSTQILNFWHENPSTDEKILATRLYCPWKTEWLRSSDVGFQEFITDWASCDWFISSVAIPLPYGSWKDDAKFNIGDGLPFPSIKINRSEVFLDEISPSGTNSQSRVANLLNSLCQMMWMTQFNHHPPMYLCGARVGGDGVYSVHNEKFIYCMNSDLQYYTSLEFEDTKSIQDVAITGLFRESKNKGKQ